MERTPDPPAPPPDDWYWVPLALLNLVFPVVALILFFVALILFFVLGGLLLIGLATAGALAYSWVRARGQQAEAPTGPRREVIDVIDLPQVQVELIELNFGESEAAWADVANRWSEQVDFHDELLRLETTPPVPALADCLATGFWQFHGAGVLLQLVRPIPPEAELSSWLVFLDGETLACYEVADVGPFVLAADFNDATRLTGYNMRRPGPNQLQLVDEPDPPRT